MVAWCFAGEVPMVEENLQITDYSIVKGKFKGTSMISLVMITGTTVGELKASVVAPGSIAIRVINDGMEMADVDVLMSWLSLEVEYPDAVINYYDIMVRDQFVAANTDHPFIRFYVDDNGQSIDIAHGVLAQDFLNEIMPDAGNGSMILYRDDQKMDIIYPDEMIYQPVYLELKSYDGTVVTDYPVNVMEPSIYFDIDYLPYCVGDILQFYESSSELLPIGSFVKWFINDELVSEDYKPNIILPAGNIAIRKVVFNAQGEHIGEHWNHDLNISGSPGFFKFSPGPEVCPGEDFQAYFDNIQPMNISWDIGKGQEYWGNHELHHRFDQEGQYAITVYLEFETCPNDTITQIINVTPNAVPLVDMHTDGYRACINDEVSFSADRWNNNFQYNWDFGDGMNAQGPEVSYAYSENGSFNATLTATNTCGGSASVSKIVNIEPGVPSDNSFHYWSQGNSCPGNIIELRANNPNETYKWMITDDQSNIYRVLYGKQTKMIFDTTGNFNVSLKTMNGCGSAGIPDANNSQNISVIYDPMDIPQNLQFRFDEMEDGWKDTITIPSDEIVKFKNESWEYLSTNYRWDFGDGSPVDSVNQIKVEHSFASVVDIIFEVQLIGITNCGGSDTIRKWVHVDPTAQPNLMLQALPDSICPGEKAAFYIDRFDFVENSGYSYDIDFGDGSALLTGITDYSEGNKAFRILVEHQYLTIGKYNFIFTVHTPGGNSVTLDDTIVVADNIVKPFYYVGNSAGKDEEPKNWEGDIFVSPTVENPDSVYVLNIESKELLTGWYIISTAINQGSEFYPVSQGIYTNDTVNKTVEFVDNQVLGLCGINPAIYNYMDDEQGNTTFMMNTDDCAQRIDHLDNRAFFDPMQNDGEEEEHGVCPGDSVEFSTFGGVSYEWHFMGDAVAEPITALNQSYHIYEVPGLYDAYVVITNNCSGTDTVYTTANIGTQFLPHANFEISTPKVDVDIPVDFKAESWGDEVINLTYQWDFGDGQIATGQEVSHSYPDPGLYEVSLTVTNGCGSMMESREIWVLGDIVNNRPLAHAGTPNPCFDMNPLIPGNMYVLDGSMSIDHLGGADLTYRWIVPEFIELNDTTSVSPEFVVPFIENEGEIIIGLEVTDNVTLEKDWDFIPLCIQGRKAIFVAPAMYGGYDGNDGSYGAPLETLMEAMIRAAAGDKILMFPGNYTTTNNVIVDKPVYIGPENMEVGSVMIHAQGMNMFQITAPDLGDEALRPVIQGLMINSADTAIIIHTSAKIEHCLIDSADVAVHIKLGSIGSRLYRNVIRATKEIGLDIQSFVSVENNDVLGGATGVQFIGSSADIGFRNNIVAYNTTGIINSSAHIIGNDYNLYFNTTDFSGLTPGANSFVADPLITDWLNYMFDLSPTSPAIDAGDPDPMWMDPDGTPGDIGAVWFYQSTEIQNIPLSAGWNIISSYIMPNNPDMMAIMQPLIDAGKLVKVMDESGKALEYVVDQWENIIGEGSNTEGYLVNVNADAMLQMVGEYVNLPLTVDLNTGWNYIGYPFDFPQPMMIFEPIVEKIVKVQDEMGATFENVPTIGYVNHIGNLRPGEGYKINVNSFVQHTYFNDNNGGATGPTKAANMNIVELQSYFKPVYTGNGYEHMNIYAVEFTINDLPMEKGDEIAVFDGDICVGVGKYDGGNFVSIISSMDDPITESKDGFTIGNAISFKVWDSSEKVEISDVKSEFATGYPERFENLGTSIVNIKANYTTTDINLINNEITQLKNNYPNPFKDYTNIEFRISEELPVTIEVYDIVGKKVAVIVDKTFESGTYIVRWNGNNISGIKLNAGIYFYKMRAGNYSSVKQMMLIK